MCPVLLPDMKYCSHPLRYNHWQAAVLFRCNISIFFSGDIQNKPFRLFDIGNPFLLNGCIDLGIGLLQNVTDIIQIPAFGGYQQTGFAVCTVIDLTEKIFTTLFHHYITAFLINKCISDGKKFQLKFFSATHRNLSQSGKFRRLPFGLPRHVFIVFS